MTNQEHESNAEQGMLRRSTGAISDHRRRCSKCLHKESKPQPAVPRMWYDGATGRWCDVLKARFFQCSNIMSQCSIMFNYVQTRFTSFHFTFEQYLVCVCLCLCADVIWCNWQFARCCSDPHSENSCEEDFTCRMPRCHDARPHKTEASISIQRNPALVTDHCLVATTLCRGQKNRFEHEHCRDRHHHRWHWYGHRLWSGQGEERREWKRIKENERSVWKELSLQRVPLRVGGFFLGAVCWVVQICYVSICFFVG